MKSIFFQILCLLTLLSMAASCDNIHKGKKLEDIANATQGDSLIYYYGQIRAAQFWREAENDSSLNTPHAREAYLRGIRAAMNLIGDDEAYNAGFMAGVQMAENIRSFSDDYDLSLNQEVLHQSLQFGLMSESSPGDDTSIESFYELLGRIIISHNEAESKKAESELKKAATKMNMTPLDNTIYRRVEKEGTGPCLEDNITVSGIIRVTKDGNDLAIPFPRDLRVGATYINPAVNRALRSMREGEKAVFATTAYALFGQRCQQMRLNPEDILTIEITLGQTIANSHETPVSAKPSNVIDTQSAL